MTMNPLGTSLRKLGITKKHKVVATAAAVGTGLAVCAWRAGEHGETSRTKDGIRRPAKLPAPLIDALAGALGEVSQILVLYPLDTVKVRCQASGETAAVVVQRLLRRGVNLKLLAKLYAGALGAAACAILVGAVHLASYEGSRKVLLKLTVTRGSTGATPTASAAGAATTTNSSEAASVGEPNSTSGTSPPLASVSAAARGFIADDDGQLGRAAVTFAAAAFAAAATALVESPVELFRHNAQAGLVSPNFLREMAATVRKEGVGGLYWGFLPHCFEAWPHDISELATYGFMREFREAALRPGSQHHAWMSNLSNQVWDLATGAASGAAAVVVSMPFDTVKTYLQTHGTDLSGRGLLGSARLFVQSGQRIVCRKGLSGLYVGVTPRLLQQVPSAMVCWWSIAAFKRFMQPHTMPEEWPGGAAHVVAGAGQGNG
ncbi:hypothetical protein Agub_g12649 [Astrephomene gubernaculifera]|uniref:Mitochondrial carrier protein n=1 Tax=Astrephomene gubernaculifera TaxID=47775 RepID=A0AAD3DYM5_9CHLO|nr:hypothetical protein Agub_g12649 [Astrephomene gubernaculifera]